MFMWGAYSLNWHLLFYCFVNGLRAKENKVGIHWGGEGSDQFKQILKERHLGFRIGRLDK